MSKFQDPYLYSNTDILINKFNIKNQSHLAEIEKEITYQKTKILLPNVALDYSGLQRVHKHLFGDLYEWAGETRTVDM